MLDLPLVLQRQMEVFHSWYSGRFAFKYTRTSDSDWIRFEP